MTSDSASHYTPLVESDADRVRGGTSHMLRKILFTSLLVTLLAAGTASAQYSVVVTPGEVTPGSTISVVGDGCAPGSEVSITIEAAEGGEAIELASVTAGDDGTYDVDAQIPADLEPGSYTVTVTCGDQVFSETITVVEATPPTTDDTTTTTGGTTTPGGSTGGQTPGGSTGGQAPGGVAGPLPRTGSNLNGFGLVGAGLLTAGGLLLIATRRRREAI